MRERLSKTCTLASVFSSKYLAQFEPMNPAPPKINTERSDSGFLMSLIVTTGPLQGESAANNTDKVGKIYAKPSDVSRSTASADRSTAFCEPSHCTNSFIPSEKLTCG